MDHGPCAQDRRPAGQSIGRRALRDSRQVSLDKLLLDYVVEDEGTLLRGGLGLHT
jgi:hypothetical protein